MIDIHIRHQDQRFMPSDFLLGLADKPLDQIELVVLDLPHCPQKVARHVDPFGRRIGFSQRRRIRSDHTRKLYDDVPNSTFHISGTAPREHQLAGQFGDLYF